MALTFRVGLNAFAKSTGAKKPCTAPP